MSLLSRTLITAALVSAAATSSAAPALAADTTAPNLSLTTSGFGTVIFNEFAWGNGTGQRAGEWSIIGPGLSAKSSEDGKVVFTRRDLFTGRALNTLAIPVAAGSYVGPQAPFSYGDPAAPTLFPAAYIPFRANVQNPIFGVRHKLPVWSVQRFDAQAIDEAGNKSRVRTTYSVVLPDVSLPDLSGIPML